MKMEDVGKDVAPVSSNKRESFLRSYISFPRGYRGKIHDSLLSTFRNNSIPPRNRIDELLKIYSGI